MIGFTSNNTVPSATPETTAPSLSSSQRRAVVFTAIVVALLVAAAVVYALRAKPFILETPIEAEGDDRRNLDTLKELAAPQRR